MFVCFKNLIWMDNDSLCLGYEFIREMYDYRLDFLTRINIKISC